MPADGFHEWQKVGAGKQPWHFMLSDESPFAFAGLWSSWRDPDAPDAAPVRSFTIITSPPNELVAPVHDRIPVILPRDRYAAWLDRETPPEALQGMLVPYPAGAMKAFPIDARVGKPHFVNPKRR